MPRAKKCKDDEPRALTPTVIETTRATAELRGAKAMPRAKKSKDDEPSTLTPTVIETMHATGKVGDTKATLRARSPKMTSQALPRRR